MEIAVVDRCYCRYAVEIEWRRSNRPSQLFIFNLSDNDVPRFIFEEFEGKGFHEMMDRYAQYVAMEFLSHHNPLIHNRGNAYVRRVFRVEELVTNQKDVTRVVFNVDTTDITPKKQG